MLTRNFVCIRIKLSAKSQTKDKTEDEHKHDLVYHEKCQKCVESYVEEAGRRL